MNDTKQVYQAILDKGMSGELTPDEVIQASLELLLILIHGDES